MPQNLIWPTAASLRTDKSALKAAQIAAFESERSEHRVIVQQRWIGATHTELVRAQSDIEQINSISVRSPDGDTEASEFVRPLVIASLTALLPGVTITEGGSFYYITLTW